MRRESPTPAMYSEINDLLQLLLLQIQSILTDKFIGMYIGGSLASNSFNCETSDVDCYIITTKTLSKSLIDKIEEMHKQLYLNKHPYTKRIEVSYIPRDDLLNFDPNGTRPYFNEGCFYQGQYGSNYEIELHVLRGKGITIIGPDIKQLTKDISPQHLKKAILKNLFEYWEANLNDDLKFSRSDYQVFAVLTMCRTLYSLETGNIASKMQAAQWVIDTFDTHWKELIEQALTWKPNNELNMLEETQQFVRYVLDMNRDNKV